MGKDKDTTPIVITADSVSNSELHIKRPIIVDDISFTDCKKEFSLERHRQPRKWAQLQLSAESERIKYRAVNFGERSAVTLPYRYAVALIDTAAHTARLYDSELMTSSRIVKNLEAADSVSRDEPKVLTGKDATSEYYKSKALLGESFGTKKTKQMLSSLDRNKIDMGQLASQTGFISKNLDSSISRISDTKESHEESTSEGASVESTAVTDSILPPHNPVTKKVDEIYRVQELIPPEIYYSMDAATLVDAIKKRDPTLLTNSITASSLNEMVSSRIKSLAALTSMPNDTALDHTVRCLIYLNYLMSFRVLNESKINGNLSNFFPTASPDIVTGLLRQFTEVLTVGNGKQRYKLSSVCRDRLIAYICILILTLDGFRTNVARLSVALQQPATKTADYLRAVGCTVEKPDRDEPIKYITPGTGREIPVKMAVLKAPLTIISNRSRGPPRRK